MGTNSKKSSNNTSKSHLIPAYTKTHIYMEKISSITRYISKFISLINFSIKITIKEKLAKNGGHLSPGNTLIKLYRSLFRSKFDNVSIITRDDLKVLIFTL